MTDTLPTNRKDALATGATQYFTGKPCKHGHVAPRRTAKGDCTKCANLCSQAWASRDRAADPEKYREKHRAFIAAHEGYHRSWYAKNAGKRRADAKAYNDANRDLVRQRAREHRAANIDAHRARDKVQNAKHQARKNAWMRENRDKCREYERSYREKNPHVSKVKNGRRRALDCAAEGSHTHQDLIRIFAAQKGRCACCKAKRKLTADHIVPLAKGGSNWPSNIQGLCYGCNSSKRDSDPIEFMRKRGALL